MEQKQVQTTREKLADICPFVTWRAIALKYFKRSSSWLYHKLDGIDSNEGFTETETEDLKKALLDISDRIRRAAEEL